MHVKMLHITTITNITLRMKTTTTITKSGVPKTNKPHLKHNFQLKMCNEVDTKTP